MVLLPRLFRASVRVHSQSISLEDCSRSEKWEELSPNEHHGECPGNDHKIGLAVQPNLKVGTVKHERTRKKRGRWFELQVSLFVG